MTAPCRSCEAPVWWATVIGSRTPMPIDDEPDAPDGNLAVSRDPFGVLVCRYLTDEAPEVYAGEHRARSHFATCPNAAEHRRPRPAVIMCGRPGVDLTDNDREAVEQFALWLDEHPKDDR